MAYRPVIGITLGDPASIGPEIVVKAVAGPVIRNFCRPLVVGDAATVRRALASTSLSLAVHPVARVADARFVPGELDLLEVSVPGVEDVVWGKVQAVAGRAAFACVERAVGAALEGEVDALTTAPLQKEALKAAGIPFVGHTEILASLTGTDDPLTMFETKELRIFFLTRHLSLTEAIRRITVEGTRDALVRAAAALERLGAERPRLALAALNPHAGENGLFGDEEARLLAPAVAATREAGVDVEGPLPADSVFWHAARGRYDAVMSLYHDQGHVAAKMYDFERTVSLTHGLPFLRTSVDHGTAFDIAGTGTASPVSMEEAISAAARYAGVLRKGTGTGAARRAR